jgi:hypothetical protein
MDSEEVKVPPVTARWVGPFQAELPDKTVLVPHETVVEVSAHEAVNSEYWQPVEAIEAKDAAELREIADRYDIKVAGNAKAETIQKRLEENGITDFVAYQDVDPESIDLGEEDEAPDTEEEPDDGETSDDAGGES